MSLNAIHPYEMDKIDGGKVRFSDFKGKKLMVVNVASRCGYTSQYQQLEELYQAFKEKLVIVGIPSNDFGGQEPGSNEDIASFCQSNYGISFLMTAKVSITGPKAHPVYQWLTMKEYNAVLDSEVKWNFNKFLIDEEGRLLKWLPSSVSPLDPEVIDWLST